jgi:hypothetical protein
MIGALTYRVYSGYARRLERGRVPPILRSVMTAIIPSLPLVYTTFIVLTSMELLVGDVYSGLFDCMTSASGLLASCAILSLVLLPGGMKAVEDVVTGLVVSRDPSQVASEMLGTCSAEEVRVALLASDAITDLVAGDRGGLGLDRDRAWDRWAAVSVASSEYTMGPPLRLIRECDAVLASMSESREVVVGDRVCWRVIDEMLTTMGLSAQDIDRRSADSIAAYVYHETEGGNVARSRVVQVVDACDNFSARYLESHRSARRYIEQARRSRKRHTRRERGNRVNYKSLVMLMVFVPAGACYISKEGHEKLARFPGLVKDRALRTVCKWGWLAHREWSGLRAPCGIDYPSYYDILDVDKAKAFRKFVNTTLREMVGRGSAVEPSDNFIKDIKSAAKGVGQCMGIVEDADFISAAMDGGYPVLLCNKMVQVAFMSMYCGVLRNRFKTSTFADKCDNMLGALVERTKEAAKTVLLSSAGVLSPEYPAMASEAIDKLLEGERGSNTASMGTREMDLLINSTVYGVGTFTKSLGELISTPRLLTDGFEALTSEVRQGVEDGWWWWSWCKEVVDCSHNGKRVAKIVKEVVGLFDAVDAWEKGAKVLCVKLEELYDTDSDESAIWRNSNELRSVHATCFVRKYCTVKVANIPTPKGWFRRGGHGDTLCQEITSENPLRRQSKEGDWLAKLTREYEGMRDETAKSLLGVVQQQMRNVRPESLALKGGADDLAEAMAALPHETLRDGSMLTRVITAAVAMTQIRASVSVALATSQERDAFNMQVESYEAAAGWRRSGPSYEKLREAVFTTARIKTKTWSLQVLKVQGVQNMVKVLGLDRPEMWKSVKWEYVDPGTLADAETRRTMFGGVKRKLEPGTVPALSARKWYKPHATWAEWREREAELTVVLEAREGHYLNQQREREQEVARNLLPR